MALDDLVNRARAALDQRLRARDAAMFRRRAHPTRRSLSRALSGDQLGYILACERPAPSQRISRVDFDAQALARTYAPFADALAVSTYAALPQQALSGARGSALGAVRGEVDMPVVCTDVIVDPIQIHETRYYGADAVLLMLSALDDATLERCMQAAEELSMDVILTVRDEDELRRALAKSTGIIGLDARSYEGAGDADVVARLAAKVPDERLCIGIARLDDHARARQMRPRVDALMGAGSLLDRDDVPRAVRELIFGRVKVCGLTHADHIQAAWRAGASRAGLIFAPGSARQITYDRARSLRAAAPIDYVGVFVDEPIEDVVCCAQRLGLSAVQMHGQEQNDYLLELRRQLPERVELWKAVALRGELPKLSSIHADRILLDNVGRGAAFDWSRLSELDERERQRIILGGGLSPDNAAHADALGTWGLDVNLGVETSAGQKSQPLLERFFAELRGRRRDRPAPTKAVSA